MSETALTLYLADLARRLSHAGHGEKGELIAGAAEFIGCSRQTLYQKLRGVGFHSGRKLRADKGDSTVSREEVVATAGQMASSWRANGKELMSVQDAMRIAHRNGLLKTMVAPGTMLRLMRLHGCHPAQMRQAEPHVQMRSLHPNHVWQLDASICVLYRLRNGRTTVMDQRKFNARKPRDLAAIINERILRYAVTDHASGSVHARYYLAAGEDQHTLFQFLMDAFRQRGQDCMFGVPMMMVWDAGSANQAHAIQSLLSALMIRHWAHTPGRPRAKGQVECVHNVIERQFEGRLALCTTDSIEQLNARLDTFLQVFNGVRKHSRHGHTRWGLWQTIREDQLRLCPPVEICRSQLMAKPIERTVDGRLTIAFTCNGYPPARYDVSRIPGVRVNERVSVRANLYKAPNVFVEGLDEHGCTRFWECEPEALDLHGFAVTSPVWGEEYRAPRNTDIDVARGDVMEAAFGVRDPVEAANAKAKGRVAFDGKVDPFADLEDDAANVPAFIQRRGTELHVPNAAQTELKPLTHVQALQELRARLGRKVERDEAQLVRERYPDGVPDEEFEQLLALIKNPTPTESERRLYAVK